MPIAVPTVTDPRQRADLIALFGTLRDVLGEALSQLIRAAPKGRDYAGQGASPLRAAMDEHHDRVRRLRQLHDEVTELFDGVMAQPERRPVEPC